MTANPLQAAWQSYVPAYGDTPSLPATFGTQEGAWTYGAVTDLIETAAPATIVIEAQAIKGKIGFCLISSDHSSLASEQRMINPADGKTTVRLRFDPSKSPARLLIRNYADEGVAGEVRVDSVVVEA